MFVSFHVTKIERDKNELLWAIKFPDTIQDSARETFNKLKHAFVDEPVSWARDFCDSKHFYIDAKHCRARILFSATNHTTNWCKCIERETSRQTCSPFDVNNYCLQNNVKSSECEEKIGARVEFGLEVVDSRILQHDYAHHHTTLSFEHIFSNKWLESQLHY